MIPLHKKTLFIACSATLSLFLVGCAQTPLPQAAAIGHYQFGYRVNSPSDIAAQVFSGQKHTYISLPQNVTLQAATGNGKLYAPKKHGPYWSVDGLATQWTFATTRGIVVAQATGAAREMAQVSQAISVVQSTAPKMTHPSVQVSLPDTKKADHPAKSLDVPADWLKPTKTTSMQPAISKKVKAAKAKTPVNTAPPMAQPHHHAILIPGSYGRSLPLTQALQRILPAGWSSVIHQPVSGSLPVLWHKGPWTQSLQRMARDNLLVAQVSWAKTQVSVSASPAMMAGIPHQHPAPQSVTHPVQKPAQLPAHVQSVLSEKHPSEKPEKPQKPQTFPWAQSAILPVPTPMQPLPPAPIHFVAKHRQMLSHDLRVYLHKKAWHLAWNLTKDYPISVGFTLQGDTRQILQKLMNLYPIMITVDAGNRTVVVTSNTQF